MPIDTTHLHLSALLLEGLRDVDAYAFCLGAIAPDCVDPSDQQAFNMTHNVDNSGRFNYLGFYRENLPTNEEDLVPRSYILGYFCHLWLDSFAKKASGKILLKPSGKQRARKQLLHSEITHLDKTTVLSTLASIKKPSGLAGLPVINGVDPNSVMAIHEKTLAFLRRIREITLPLRFVSASAYADFMTAAKKGFCECLRDLRGDDPR